MRYAVVHVTTYRYAAPVERAWHKTFLTPRELTGQRVLSTRLTIAPEPSLVRRHVDHFGNHAAVFSIDVGHVEFRVEAVSEVEVAHPWPPAATATPAWEWVRDSLAAAFPDDVEASEFVHDSPLAAASDTARDYARPSFAPGTPVLVGALDLTRRIYADFAYRPGVTDIGTPVAEVFATRVGVCQDFAHVQIAALRSLGLAVRYVSGYIRTFSMEGAEDLRGADASHAWVAVWCGPDTGWIHLDPTNNLFAREDHVVVAWGRDFADVSPARGVVLGGGDHMIEVAVDLARLP